MKREAIKAGRAYVNKSGRTERYVLDIGDHITPEWYGDTRNRPWGELVVRFVETRLGKTFYSNKRPHSVYLSTFAAWAHDLVPAGGEAPYPTPPATGDDA